MCTQLDVEERDLGRLTERLPFLNSTIGSFVEDIGSGRKGCSIGGVKTETVLSVGKVDNELCSEIVPRSADSSDECLTDMSSSNSLLTINFTVVASVGELR